MSRVAGVDPGTMSFDLCVRQDSETVVQDVFDTGSVSADSGLLLEALAHHGPYDLVYGPSGYGLPLVPAAEVGERELALMVLVRPDERNTDSGIAGLRGLLRALAGSGLPVVFGPGVIHLPSVPCRRKYNRIDLGTADKVCAAAYAIADQATRRAIALSDTAMILLELGGAFTAALAIAGGKIVDGFGGSSGPLGVRAAGALDGELAYLLGPALRKSTLFTGGALVPLGGGAAGGPAAGGAAGGPAAGGAPAPAGARTSSDDLKALWSSPAHADGWAALLEAAAKAVRALTVSVPAPHEIVISGRLARLPMVISALASSVGDIAPVIALAPERASAAAHGAALLADALIGGVNAALADVMRLRECSGSALDHLRVSGAQSIALG